MQTLIATLLPSLFQDLLLEYDKGLDGKLARSTRYVYVGEVQRFLFFLTGLKVIEVSGVKPAHIEGYLMGLERKGYAAVTRQRKLSVLRSFFAWSHQRGYVRGDPSASLIPPRWVRKRPRVLLVDEYTRLLAVIDDVRDRAIVELILQAGLRLVEVYRLNTADVSLPQPLTDKNVGRVQVDGRGSSGGQLYLNDKVCRALAAWLDERPCLPTDALFVSRNNRRLSRRQIQRLMDKYVQEAELEHATIQALRHSFAAHHLLNGTPVNQVKEYLGHKWLRSTQVYVEAARSLEARYIQEHGI